MKNKRGYQKLLAFIKNKEAIKSSCIYKNKKVLKKLFLPFMQKQKSFLALYAKTKKLSCLYAKTKKPGNGNKSYRMSDKTVIR